MNPGEPDDEERRLQERAKDFALKYNEAILARLFEFPDAATIDVHFRNCPREHLANVAFLFLHHMIVDELLPT